MVHPHRALDVVANPAVERVRDVREARHAGSDLAVAGIRERVHAERDQPAGDDEQHRVSVRVLEQARKRAIEPDRMPSACSRPRP